MPNNRSSRQADGSRQESGAARLAGSIYGGASAVAALIFWLVTTFTGSYPAVARYGGAIWVFILTMIVLMPLIIPRVRNRRRENGALVAQPDPSDGSSAP